MAETIYFEGDCENFYWRTKSYRDFRNKFIYNDYCFRGDFTIYCSSHKKVNIH